jgi:O-succinylbenzoate synthase
MDSDIKIQPKIFHFNIQLHKPLWIRGIKITNRTGFLLVLSLPDGQRGVGEISPLPGLHKETAYDAGNQLQDLCAKLPDFSQLNTEFNANTLCDSANIYPSVRFGCESAVIDLLAAHSGTDPASVLLPTNTNTVIRVNGLVTREDDEKTQLEAMVEAGYRTIKIKLGNNSLREDIKKIHDFCSVLPPEIKIRIDANQAWNLHQAEEFYNRTTDLNIEYIEEPLENTDELPELFNQTAMPIALDESLDFEVQVAHYASFCYALVLKPAQLGGVQTTYQYMQQAMQSGLKTIISDTFQSGVGATMLANLAVLAQSDTNAMGFDTLRWLKDDVLHKAIQIQQGLLDLVQINQLRHELKFESLERIV